MEIKKLYVVIDKDFKSYEKGVIKGCFDNTEEASKLCDSLNIKHYMQYEAKPDATQIKSRYMYIDIESSISYIVKKILDNS